MKFRLFLTSIILVWAACLIAQVTINKEWVVSDGEPDQIDWSASTLDGSNLLVTSNTKTPNGTTNVLTIKYDKDGSSIWKEEFDSGNNENDYGAAIAPDAYGNIYVAGAITN